MAKDPLDWIGERGEVSAAKDAAPAPAGKETKAPPSGASPQAAPAEAHTGEPDTELASAGLPKYATLIPLTARVTEEQLDYLETMERRIMRSRRRKHERITKNTLIRAAIELLRALPWDYTDIADENELVMRLLQAAGVSPEL